MTVDRKLEEEILASFERDEWRSIPGRDAEAARYANYATRPDHREITIQIAARDLDRLQAQAAERGLPLEALLESILRDHVEGGTEASRKSA